MSDHTDKHEARTLAACLRIAAPTIDDQHRRKNLLDAADALDAQAATIATLTAERDEARAIIAAASEYVEKHVYLPGIPSAMERVLTPAQAAEYRARRIATSALREILGGKQ